MIVSIVYASVKRTDRNIGDAVQVTTLPVSGKVHPPEPAYPAVRNRRSGDRTAICRQVSAAENRARTANHPGSSEPQLPHSDRSDHHAGAAETAAQRGAPSACGNRTGTGGSGETIRLYRSVTLPPALPG